MVWLLSRSWLTDWAPNVVWSAMVSRARRVPNSGQHVHAGTRDLTCGKLGGVDVTLLYLDGCPNWRQAEEVVHQALREVGLPEHPVTLRRVDTPEDAKRLSFHGSPTMLVDGADPFADPSTPVGLMCRVYRTDDGFAGSPTLEQMTAALRSRP